MRGSSTPSIDLPLGRLFAWAIGLLLAVGAGARQGAIAAGTCEPAVPCQDVRGCPDLVVDQNILSRDAFIEVKNFPKRSCPVQEGEIAQGKRIILRFTSNTPNLGPGDLIIGNPGDHPEWFDFGSCHGHPHFKEYADYRLWTPEGYEQWQALRAADPVACARDLLAAHPELESQLVQGHKQGFCAIDIAPSEVPCNYPADPPKYDRCDEYGGVPGNQGISVCWADEYYWGLDGQWVDVTDVADGDYVLEVEVNAERFFEEADYSNNSSAILINIVKPFRKGHGKP